MLRQCKHVLLFILVLCVSNYDSLAKSDQSGCLYGWQLSDENLCSINCFPNNERKLNPYCRLNVYKNLEVIYNQTSLSMPSGKILFLQKNLPFCQNITLLKHQFKIASNGQLEIGARYFPIKDYKMSEDLYSVSFCYPLSPQLLQCDHKITEYKNYHIINSTKLMMTDNLTTYLGDFYIMENGSAVTCKLNINSKIHYIDMPRCNYLTIDKKDIIISNGSAIVGSTNFTIRNPIYSIITSNDQVQVCIPLSLRMRSCNHFVSAPPVYFHSNKNLSAYSLTFNENLNPDAYFITSENVLCFCANKNPDETPLQIFWFVKSMTALTISACLIATLIVKRRFFAQNYHCKAILCHILAFILYLVSYGARHVKYQIAYLPCYIAFCFYYYFSMTLYAWLSVISYDSWKNISRLQSVTLGCSSLYSCIKPTSLQSFILYNIFAWGVPAILLTITLSMNLLPSPFDFQNNYIPYIQPICLITAAKCYNIYFSFPASCFSFTAIMFVISTIFRLRQASMGTELVNQRRNIQIIIVSIRIAIVMGLIWMFILIFNLVAMFQPHLILIIFFGGSLSTIIQGGVLVAFYFPFKKLFKCIRDVIIKMYECTFK